MKKMLLTCLLLSFTGISMAQISFHFPHTDAAWGQFVGVYYDSPFGDDYYAGSSSKYIAAGDSMLNGYSYIKMYSADAAGNMYNIPPRLIREEEDKVYYYLPSMETDTLLYDFSLQPGQVAQVYSDYPNYSLAVDSVGQIMIANQLRKCIYFNDPAGYALFDQINYFGDNHDPVMWIEGIGSNDGLFSPGGGCNIVDGIGFLTCFEEHDTLKYGMECNLTYDGVSMPEANKSLQIFPNPAAGKFSIICNNPAAVEAELIVYSPAGQMIYHQKMTTSVTMRPAVDLTSYPGGLYLVQLQSAETTLMEKLLLQE